MSIEMTAKINARAVPIRMTPLWSVAVMTVRGADCPGNRLGKAAPPPLPSVVLVALESIKAACNANGS